MNRIDRPSACPEFLEVFTDFVDGTLPPDREGELRAHLDCCEGCLHHLAAYRRGVMALRAHEADVDPREFWSALERRLWTEGHLAGGAREPAGPGRSWWSHPATAMAAAACFAVVVFFAGVWGDRVLSTAGGGDRPAVARASVGGGGPVVVPSEPIELAGTALAETTDEATTGEAMPDETARAEPESRTSRPAPGATGSVPVVRAALDGGAPAGAGPIDRDADLAYVAALQREAAAIEAIERTRSRPARDGLRTAWSSRVTGDGWIEPVRLGAAGIRRLQARAPVVAWPVEAALSLP